MKFQPRYAMCLPLVLSLAACSASDDRAEQVGEIDQQLPAGDTDYTPTTLANVTVQQKAPVAGEGPANLIDTSASTKIFISKNRSWFQYRMTAPTVIRSYDITSANDIPERDPKEWTFEGSFDGFRWVTLHTVVRTETFPQRETTYTHTFSNTTPYLYYRLNVTRNSATSGGDLQLSGLRVGGSRPTGTVPATVAAVNATVSGTSATVSWASVSGATGYYVQRSSEDGKSAVEFTTTSTSYVDSGLMPGTVYVYRVQAHNGGTLRGFPSPLSNAVVTAAPPSGLKDVTALSSFAPTDQFNTTGLEGIEKVTDGAAGTKYLTFNTTTWLQQQTVAGAVITQYTLTSGNDYPGRDPKDWRLQGSSSATGPWTTLDTRTNQGFPARGQTRTFSANASNQAYAYYRLVIDANRGEGITQLAEWRLYGTATGSQTAPAAPSGLALNAVTSNQIIATWTDNAGRQSPESSFRVERAPNSSFTAGQITTYTAGAGSTEFRATSLSPSTQYCFRVAAVNAVNPSATTSPVCVTTPALTDPPQSWVETGWYGGHNRTLTRRPLDTHIAMYADEFVSPQSSIDWLRPILDAAWGYAKTKYGSFSDPYLYVIANQDNVFVGHPYTVAGVQYASEASAFYRNVVFSPRTDWTNQQDDWFVASFTHEMGHIVESNNNAVFGSPAFQTWGDSKWAEIFQWDVYENVASLLPTGFKDRAWAELNQNTDDDGIYWFRDFWFPIYANQVGGTRSGAAQLDRFFELMAQYLPQVNTRYAKDLNLGEFIHFMSGAAGVNVEAQAKVAFRWNSDTAVQLATAQQMYPAVHALYSGGTCTPETNAAFCTRVGASCGSVTANDNCGTSRTVTSCGSCTSPQTCGGGGTANQCGGGSGTNPCASLCSSPVVFTSASYQPPGGLGTGATCHETTVNLAGMNCGNFAAGRTFSINGTLVSCNGGNVTLPAKRNGGYCMQASAGNYSYAYFQTW